MASKEQPPVGNLGVKKTPDLPEGHQALHPDDPLFLEKLRPHLQALPPEEREIITSTFEATLSMSGPIPPPAIAAGYEKLLSGATDRLFTMAETQVASFKTRIDGDVKGEQDVRDKNQSYRVQGLWAGAIVSCILVCVGGCVAIFAGSPITGSLVSVFGVATGLAGIFVQGRPLMDSDKTETAPAPADAAKRPVKRANPAVANQARQKGKRR